MYLAFKNLNMQKKRYTVVRKLKLKYNWCFSRLKCKNICAADPIDNLTAKNSRNNAFRRKETTNKILLNISGGFKVRRKVRLMLWRPNDDNKGKCYIFSAYKERNKMFLAYLLCKLQKERYGLCIFNLKCHKTVERTHLETSNQQTRYRWCFYMLKCLPKLNHCVFGLYQQTTKVQCIYLSLKTSK